MGDDGEENGLLRPAGNLGESPGSENSVRRYGGMDDGGRLDRLGSSSWTRLRLIVIAAAAIATTAALGGIMGPRNTISHDGAPWLQTMTTSGDGLSFQGIKPHESDFDDKPGGGQNVIEHEEINDSGLSNHKPIMQESSPSNVDDSLANFYNDPFDTYACRKYFHATKGSLPDFLIAGAHKAGSTALYGYLVQHGHVRPSSCKETRFFTLDILWKRGIKYYRRHFYDTSETPWVLTGEGTPSYIRHPIAPVRIAHTLPRVKVITTLRNPVERFVSHYVGFVERNLTTHTCKTFWRSSIEELDSCAAEITSSGALPLNFGDAPAAAEVDGLDPWDALRYYIGDSAQISKIFSSKTNLGPAVRPHRPPVQARASCAGPLSSECIRRNCLWSNFDNAIARSIYVDQIVRWLRYFKPDQLLFIQAEKLYQDTPTTLQEVAAFLGLRPFSDSEIARFSETHRGSSHHTSPLATTCNRRIIAAYFERDNELLNALLAAQYPSVHARWVPWT